MPIVVDLSRNQMKKVIKRTMTIFISLISIVVLAVFVFMQQAKFGKLPSGKRLARIEKSPHYKNGAFENLNNTPMLTDGITYFGVLKEFMLAEKKRNKPTDTIPSIKTNLLTLDPNQNVLVWFGHSSYFIQLDGKKILVDPVLSGAASPIAFTTRAFTGTDAYSIDDLPEIDYLFISHDHWDHIDYETIQKLKPKVKKVICGLGVGEHFEYWGYDTTMIEEHDWNTKITLDSGFSAHVVPARHFSGRGFTRNKSLWASYVLKTPSAQIYIGGDSGYDNHFAEIGKFFGEFDLVILENGQYDKSWKYIHMMPSEVLKAAQDLHAKRLFPVHSSKFALANHAWDDPLKQITEYNKSINLPLVTPIIGELVNLNDSTQKFAHWWEGVR
jgi:L-ascorbate metabolism protein UlaG (beta-lactamase superfamily)